MRRAAGRRRRALPVRRDPAAGQPRPAVRRGAGAALGAARAVRAGQGARLLARPLRPGHRQRAADHRHGLHRPARRAAGRRHPDRHRADLRGAVLRSTSGAAPGCCRRSGSRCCVRLRDPARPDLAGHRPAVPGRARPSRTRRRPTSRTTSRRPAQAYDLNDIEVDGLHQQRHGGHRASSEPDRPDQPRRPLVDPQLVRRGLRADPAGARPTTRSPTCSTSTATRSTARTARSCSARASSTRPASPPSDQQLVQPAHRLHPRQRRDRRVRQPAARRTTRPQSDRDPVGRGPATPAQDSLRRRVTGEYRAADLLRRGQPRLLDRRQGARWHATSSSTCRPAAAATHAEPRRTPARAGCRSAASSTSCCTP